MISVELLAKHMAWANQEIFKEVKKLGPEVLDYYVVDEEWTVIPILKIAIGNITNNPAGSPLKATANNMTPNKKYIKDITTFSMVRVVFLSVLSVELILKQYSMI